MLVNWEGCDRRGLDVNISSSVYKYSSYIWTGSAWGGSRVYFRSLKKGVVLPLAILKKG